MANNRTRTRNVAIPGEQPEAAPAAPASVVQEVLPEVVAAPAVDPVDPDTLTKPVLTANGWVCPTTYGAARKVE